jgi:hypothetical protein
MKTKGTEVDKKSTLTSIEQTQDKKENYGK